MGFLSKLAEDTVSFRIKSPCGMTFEMPVSAIWDDFKELIKVSEGVDDLEAEKIVERRKVEEPDFWKQWFNEQFAWADIERLAKIVVRPSDDCIDEYCRYARADDDSGPAFFVIDYDTH